MIKLLKHNLLGLPAIKELLNQLLAQIDLISLNHDDTLAQLTGAKVFSSQWRLLVDTIS